MNHRSRIAAIFTLAYPIVIAQLGTILQGWADTIMVGQYGTPELSAAGFVNNIFNLCIFFLLGISYATTPVVGTLFSQGNYPKVLSTLRESNVVNVLVSLFIVLILFILYLNIDCLRQPVELLSLIRPYFIVLLLSLPFLSLFNSMKQFSDALGDTRTPMWIMIGCNVINLILNYLLIFTFDMGLLGAGIATLMARALMPLAMWLALRHGSLLRSLHSKIPSSSFPLASSPFPFNFQLLKLGLPISIQLCLEASAFNISAIFMGWIGASALAAHQIMATVSSLAFMVYYGIGAAAAIRIAYFMGQNEWDEVRKTAWTSLWMSIASGVVVVSFLCVFGTSIAHIFTTSSEVAILFLSFFPPFICYQIGDCLQITYANALRGIKDVRAMMLYAFIAYILVSLPLAYIFAFPLHMGAVGVWWSFPFGLTTAGLCYYFQFRKHYKKQNRLI